MHGHAVDREPTTATLEGGGHANTVSEEIGKRRIGKSSACKSDFRGQARGRRIDGAVIVQGDYEGKPVFDVCNCWYGTILQ